MIANISATRMELLRLRRRVALASRGHRLLSEKRDEISRQLIRVARENIKAVTSCFYLRIFYTFLPK